MYIHVRVSRVSGDKMKSTSPPLPISPHPPQPNTHTRHDRSCPPRCTSSCSHGTAAAPFSSAASPACPPVSKSLSLSPLLIHVMFPSGTPTHTSTSCHASFLPPPYTHAHLHSFPSLAGAMDLELYPLVLRVTTTDAKGLPILNASREVLHRYAMHAWTGG